MSDKIELGRRYKDVVTGFAGTAYALSEYLYGSPQVLLIGTGPNGEPLEFWFVVERVSPAGEIKPLRRLEDPK